MKAAGTSHGVRQLDADSFAEGVAHGIVLVCFGEPWCGPSQVQSAILGNLEARFGAQVTVAEVNIDNAQDWAVRFHLGTLPTLLLFKDGQLLRRFAGVQREARLAKALQAAIAG